jgi:hypothetical protein
MNTTTITGHGVGGQRVTKELPAEGEIIVITTGSTKTRTWRQTTARVTGWDTRSITGTGFCYYVVVAVSATGETLADSRVRPATAEEAAEFAAATAPAEVPFEIIPAEVAAHRDHSAACIVCRYSGETGRSCDEGMKLWEAAHRARRDLDRAPIVTMNRWGTRKAHWNAMSALAEIGINGGEIIQAPAGMIEAGRAEQARELAAARARRASGARPRRPRRR